MKKELTTQLLMNAKCRPGKTKEEWVDMTSPADPHRGLYCTIKQTQNDRIPFLLRMKVDGKTKHFPIGYFPDESLEQLRTKAAETRAQVLSGHLPTKKSVNQNNSDPQLLSFLEDTYLPYKKTRKKSWQDDEAIINLRIKPSFLAGKRLSGISRQDIEKLHTEILESGKSPATANHVMKLLRHALNLAVSWSLLDKNPASGIKLFHEDNEVNNILTEQQLKKLLEVLNTYRNRTVSLICLYLLSTGARLSEVLNAEHQHIKLEERLWIIPAKNSKSKRIRSVPLNDSALNVLKQLKTKESDVYLFLNEKTGKPYTTIHKTWSRIRKKAGVPFLRLHDLRHSYASFLVNSGRTLLEVAEILGHQDIKVSRRYSHLSTRTLQDAANSASDIINDAMGYNTTEQ